MSDEPILDEVKKSKKPKEVPIVAFGIATLMVLGVVGLIFSATTVELPEVGSQSLWDLCSSQVLFSFILFVVPALMLRRIAIGHTPNFFKLNKHPKWQTIAIFIALLFSANFFLHWFIGIMEIVPISESLSDKFLKIQGQSEDIYEYLLSFKTLQSFIIVFMTMAVAPAIAEELFFRGLIQGSLVKHGLHPYIAIFISAFLFGIIHAQFINFLALFFVGSVLGYAYHVTKNLWVPIIGHLFNNGLIVILTYLNHFGYINFDIEAEPHFIVSIIAIAIFIGLIYMFTVQSKQKIEGEVE